MEIGDESSLTDCQHSKTTDCTNVEDAGVICKQPGKGIINIDEYGIEGKRWARKGRERGKNEGSVLTVQLLMQEEAVSVLYTFTLSSVG